MKTQQLRPRVLVSYVREPYVYAAGNVRVTFDSNIRTSLFQREFLNGALPDIIATDAPGDIILEVKYDAFLPEVIRPKGNTSLTSIANDPTTDRYSFKLEFDHYVDGQTCFGLDKLILNNNYADATNMKEALIYDMYQYLGADGLPLQLCQTLRQWRILGRLSCARGRGGQLPAPQLWRAGRRAL